MSAIVLAVATARVVLFSVLAMGALGKLRTPRTFATTLTALGLRRPLVWWLLTCTCELAVAALAILPIDSLLPTAAVATLGLVFAAAGVRGIRLGGQIDCACFGQVGRHRLGYGQLFALPAWLAGAALLTLWRPGSLAKSQMLLASALLLMLAVYMARLVRLTLRAREIRVTATRNMPSPAASGGWRVRR